VARIEQKENGYKVLVGKSEGRRSLGRYGRRLEDNIKQTDRREIGCGVTEWIHLAQNRDQ
jgi:hypothetical protein